MFVALQGILTLNKSRQARERHHCGYSIRLYVCYLTRTSGCKHIQVGSISTLIRIFHKVLCLLPHKALLLLVNPDRLDKHFAMIFSDVSLLQANIGRLQK